MKASDRVSMTEAVAKHSVSTSINARPWATWHDVLRGSRWLVSISLVPKRTECAIFSRMYNPYHPCMVYLPTFGCF